MSTEGFEGGEDFADEAEPSGEDESVSALQGLISEQVDGALSEHRAAERILEIAPEIGSDPKAQEEFMDHVRAAAERAGVEPTMGLGMVLLEQHAAQQPEQLTPTEVFDRQVLNSEHLGSRVLDF